MHREIPFVLSLGAVVALYLLLALLGALTDWWWIDEAYTWDMVQHPAPEIVARAAADVHPPLYYLALAGESLA